MLNYRKAMYVFTCLLRHNTGIKFTCIMTVAEKTVQHAQNWLLQSVPPQYSLCTGLARSVCIKNVQTLAHSVIASLLTQYSLTTPSVQPQYRLSTPQSRPQYSLNIASVQPQYTSVHLYTPSVQPQYSFSKCLQKQC